MSGGGYLGGSSVFFASRPRFKHGARPITPEEKLRFKHVTVDVGKARKLKRRSLQERFELLSEIRKDASNDPKIDAKALDAELTRLREVLGLQSKKMKKKRGPRKK